jgi:hypothetical protein
MKAGWWQAAAIVMALTLALVPIPPSAVERWYSGGVYPAIQHTLTRLSDLAPFALLDVLLLGAVVWWIGALIRDIRRRKGRRAWWRVTLRGAVRSVTVAAVAYIAFAGAWGLNYRRVPLTEKLAFDAAAVTPEAARELAVGAVDQVNALYDAAHLAGADASQNADLVDAFARAQTLVGVTHLARHSHPKRSLLDPYFRAAAVDGMTDPFFLETLLVSDLLPFERPFVVAHEWSHLAGFADESEANFVGWLTCLNGAESLRYSGWLFLFREVLESLDRDSRSAVAAGLAAGPRADLQAIEDRLRRSVNPTIFAIGWRAYDGYLKANRVEAGAASYAEVVRLVLGVRFGPDWTPQRLR